MIKRNKQILITLLCMGIIVVVLSGCRNQEPIETDTPASQSLDNQIFVSNAITLNLSELHPGAYVYGSEEFDIQNGDINLYIENCLWTSETQEIQIGFYNLETFKCYGCQFTGGTLTNYSISSMQIPDGRYKIYVKNCGMLMLETGILKYVVNSYE